RTPLTDSFDNTPAFNPTTDAGATLGRVLFYDRLLSLNGTVSCASCHVQSRAFTDPRRLSIGFEGDLTGRNSMPLVNLRYYGGGQRDGAMFWDHRADSLETQVLMPIQDSVEMGLTLDELQARVSEATYYPDLFQAAFGDPTVTTTRIAQALAQFVRAIAAFDSPFDQAIAQGFRVNEDFPAFSAQENEGKRLFFQPPPNSPTDRRATCAACHLPGGPDNLTFFFVDGIKNNGLPDEEDLGFGEVTGLASDDRKFKSPSLRNVAETGPYMHDGRFQTLEAVIRFYSRGIRPDPNLDPILVGRDGAPIRFGFNPDQEAALVAFLMTLSDSQVLTDPRFGDPFPQ
ncbi:MAG: cytochrome c peroxidase, partial [Myxococcota bacterium]